MRLVYIFIGLIIFSIASREDINANKVKASVYFLQSGFIDLDVKTSEGFIYEIGIYKTGGNKDLKVNVSVDKRIIQEYNEETNTQYKFLPEKYYSIKANEILINKNEERKKIKVNFENIDKQLVNRNYVLPLKIEDVNPEVDILESKRTVFLHISNSKEYGKTNIADLALIYQGGVHRKTEWTKDKFLPYIIHKNKKGEKNWLFDGFLFLEFKNGKGRMYAHGYADKAARKQEWEWLLNQQFKKDRALSALNQAIEEQINEIGNPPFKHSLIVSIPTPILNQLDWGNIDGETLRFDNDADRIKAVKWYINTFLDRFEKTGYGHLDLEGFYWVDEQTSKTENILPLIGSFIRSKNLRFFWIPYWNAEGHERWKKLGFDFAWYQPNHFFSKDIKDQRLHNATERAQHLNAGLEMEFDGRALANSQANFRNRLKSYINVFEEEKAFKEASIAYYQGGDAFYRLATSDDPKDKLLFNLLAEKIVERKRLLRPTDIK